MADHPNSKRNNSTEHPLKIERELVDEPMHFGLTPLGTSGLKESGGYIYEEFLPQLTGGKAAKLYGEMDKNSASIGAIRRLMRDLIRQVEWTVNPSKNARDEVAAKREAEFVDGCRNDMSHSWADLISEALTMVEHGFAPCEMTYKLRRGPDQPPEFESKFTDGRIGWQNIELRAQETLDRWEFERGTRRLKGMWQTDHYGNGGRRARVFIPIDRLVLFRTESSKSNPEGRSLYRNAVVPYLHLRRVEAVEMIGVERDLVGLPVMEVPLAILKYGNQDATANAIKTQLERQLSSLRRHEREYLIIPTELGPDGQPTGYKFRLQQGGGARQLNVVEIKNSYKTDIFQSCLAQFLQLGQGASAGGSRALSADQTDIFSLVLNAILESIREAFQRQCIDRLCALNGIPVELIPELSFGEIDNANLAALGAYITNLHNAGILVPDEELEKHLYTVAGLPWTRKIVEVVPADELIGMAMGGEDLSGIAGGAGPAQDSKDVEVEILNGAQLQSLVSVVQEMAAGTLPKASAAAILQSSLGMEPGTVEGILAPVQEKLDTTGPVAQPSPFGPPRGKPPMPGQPPAAGAPPGEVVDADDLIEQVMPSGDGAD